MALLGSKSKGINTDALQAILNQGAQKQTGLINEAFAQTPALTQQFGRTQTALGKAFGTEASQRAQTFGQGLQQVESPDFIRAQQAQASKLAFRNLPAAQQNIRENLAATGGLNRGVAIRALQQPVLQAQEAASDEGFRIQQAGAQRDIARRTAALDTVFRTGQGAALTKLGIDRETAQVLLENGRSDILDRAFKLAGIEEGRTQGLLDISQLRGKQSLAEAQAKRGRVAAIGSLAGAVIGAVGGGGPVGSAVGSQVGGQLGSLAAS